MGLLGVEKYTIKGRVNLYESRARDEEDERAAEPLLGRTLAGDGKATQPQNASTEIEKSLPKH